MRDSRIRGLSLKRGFGGCGHGLGRCDGLGRSGAFDGFSGFKGFKGIFKWFLRFIYSATKGYLPSSRLSSEIFLAESWATNK